MLICPKCKEKLVKEENRFFCLNNHVYDVAKKGYVNLMLANQKHSLAPGDNELMINARKNFLNKGYYLKLSQKVNAIVKSLVNSEKISVLDVGCGEGYYTNNLSLALLNSANIVGIDISKVAIHKAVKNKSIQYVVASANNLPIENESVNAIVNIFAPFNTEEFYRVLKNDGALIVVCAGAEHLKELKTLLYENVVNLEEKDFVNHMLTKFSIFKKHNLKYEIEIENNNDLLNLFSMTPYYYTSTNAQRENLKNVNKLKVTCSFSIFVLNKALN